MFKRVQKYPVFTHSIKQKAKNCEYDRLNLYDLIRYEAPLPFLAKIQ